MLPSGTNAAVMVEYTERGDDTAKLVYKPVGPGDHIMQTGEDAAQGSVLLPQNHCLRPRIWASWLWRV